MPEQRPVSDNRAVKPVLRHCQQFRRAEFDGCRRRERRAKARLDNLPALDPESIERYWMRIMLERVDRFGPRSDPQFPLQLLCRERIQRLTLAFEGLQPQDEEDREWRDDRTEYSRIARR